MKERNLTLRKYVQNLIYDMNVSNVIIIIIIIQVEQLNMPTIWAEDSKVNATDVVASGINPVNAETGFKGNRKLRIRWNIETIQI